HACLVFGYCSVSLDGYAYKAEAYRAFPNCSCRQEFFIPIRRVMRPRRSSVIIGLWPWNRLTITINAGDANRKVKRVKPTGDTVAVSGKRVVLTNLKDAVS